MQPRCLRTTIASLIAVVVILGAGASAYAAPKDPRLAAVKSFAFAIGDSDLDKLASTRLAPYGLVVVDGEGTTAEQVAKLRSNGSIVLGYLSVGSIERGRSWFRAAAKYRLEYWPEWGEWYAEVSESGFRNLMVQRVAPKVLKKGFDGLFLDNTDMIEAHPGQASGMRTLIRRLAGRVHGGGGFLFAQNGEDSIGPSLRYLDGWNREDVGFTYDFDKKSYARVPAADNRAALAALRTIGEQGLLTTGTSYTAGSAARAAEAVRMICGAGAVPFVSNILLTRIGRPQVCPAVPVPST